MTAGHSRVYGLRKAFPTNSPIALGDGSGRRVSTKPTVIVAESTDEAAALAGLERWKARYPEVAALLEPHHVLNDKMRGRSSTWTRIRVNLEAVPEDQRPVQGTPDPDDAPRWAPPR